MNTLNSIAISTARSKDEAAYRTFVETALDFYYGRQLDWKYFDPSNKFQDMLKARMEPVLSSLNITAMICDKIGGGIYERKPMRFIKTPMKDVDKRLQDAWEYDEVYTDMDEVQAIKVLVGNVFVAPVWNSVIGETVNQIFTPDQVRIVQNKTYPDQADTMCFMWSNVDSGDAEPVVYSKVYDKKGWKVVEGDAVSDSKCIDAAPINHPETGEPWEGDNILPGEIPVANFSYRREAGTGSFYGVGLMHELVPANMTVNILITALNLLSKDMGISTPVFKNVDDATRASLVIGLINNAIFLKDLPGDVANEASLAYVSPTGDTSQLRGAIESYIGSLFARFGLRNSNPFRIDIGNVESGVAKWIADADVRREQYKQVPRCRVAEKMLARYWMATDFDGRKIPIPSWMTGEKWGYEFEVNYPNPRKSYDTNETIAIQEWSKSNGFMNSIDIAMETDPDIKSREEAQMLIVERKIEEKATQQMIEDGIAKQAEARLKKQAGIATGTLEETDVLNGAQIAQAVAIVEKVSAGLIPRDAGHNMMTVLFGLTPDVADKMLGAAGTDAFKALSEAVKPKPVRDFNLLA